MSQAQPTLEQLLQAAGASKAEAQSMADELRQECTWIGTEDEVALAIGIGLIRDTASPRILRIVSPERIVEWHNANARALAPLSIEDSNAGYSDLVTLIGTYGVEDAFGDGDYWVISDSFSTPNVTVQMFKAPPVPDEVQKALKKWLTHHPSFASVVVTNEDGDELFRASA